MDDFVMPSVQTQLLDTFDIESVEVLRGPQGTLFGKNTTGGAVNIRTKRPDMDETSAPISACYGSFNACAAAGLRRLARSSTTSCAARRRSLLASPTATTSSAPTTARRFVRLADRPTIVERPQRHRATGKTRGGDDILNGRVKALWKPNDNAEPAAAVRVHARPLGCRAVVQRHAGPAAFLAPARTAALPLELARLHAAERATRSTTWPRPSATTP